MNEKDQAFELYTTNLIKNCFFN